VGLAGDFFIILDRKLHFIVRLMGDRHLENEARKIST